MLYCVGKNVVIRENGENGPATYCRICEQGQEAWRVL